MKMNKGYGFKNMIKEDYVSFEIAKLLKEKGFNEEVRTFYSYDSELKTYDFQEDDRWDMPNNWGGYYLSAPTLQMAMKWLREVHDIYIMIDKDFVTENGWHYVVVRKRDWADNIDKGITKQESNSYTYEFACEAAIKYCLENLI